MPIDGSGQAAFTTSALSVGSHTISADFSDGSLFAPSTGSVVQVVKPTLVTLSAEVRTCPGGLNEGQCRALLTRLAAAERDVTARQPDAARHALEQFIHEVTNLSRPAAGAGTPPRLDAATAVLWIAEAETIIAALSS